jgi:hypothetical protein
MLNDRARHISPSLLDFRSIIQMLVVLTQPYGKLHLLVFIQVTNSVVRLETGKFLGFSLPLTFSGGLDLNDCFVDALLPLPLTFGCQRSLNNGLFFLFSRNLSPSAFFAPR